jgi:flagellar motility protein MotE (MotC chaperone)
MKPKPTPKPVNKNLYPTLAVENRKDAALDYLAGVVAKIKNETLPVFDEWLGIHDEKFDTHRDKINEVATELNAMSKQTHERLLELAEINQSICQVMDSEDAKLEEAIKWNRRTLWVLAITQGIIIAKIFFDL